MSDEDERPITIKFVQIARRHERNKSFFFSFLSSPRPINERRLNEIRTRLHILTREKTKYNLEKLNQDAQFLRGEMEDLSRTIRELSETIRTLIRQRRTLV